jgi:hypothetical protein
MASSLAASIKSVFNIESELLEGHGGIFEIAIDGQRIYTNRSECSVFPDPKEIFQTIIERGAVPVLDGLDSDTVTLSMEGLACPLPSASPPGQGGQACDCSSGNDAMASSSCCGPSVTQLQPLGSLDSKPEKDY